MRGEKIMATASDDPAVCICPKVECPRHGDCARCRSYHAHTPSARKPCCERRLTRLKRLLRMRLGWKRTTEKA
jgi:hypothetical protein